jgi:hypothetical protein
LGVKDLSTKDIPALALKLPQERLEGMVTRAVIDHNYFALRILHLHERIDAVPDGTFFIIGRHDHRNRQGKPGAGNGAKVLMALLTHPKKILKDGDNEEYRQIQVEYTIEDEARQEYDADD